MGERSPASSSNRELGDAGDAMFWPGAPAFRQHPQATDFADEFLRQQGALPPGAPPGFHQAGPQHPIGRGPLQPMMPAGGSAAAPLLQVRGIFLHIEVDSSQRPRYGFGKRIASQIALF